MKLIIKDNYSTMSEWAAEHIASAINNHKENRPFVLGLPFTINTFIHILPFHVFVIIVFSFSICLKTIGCLLFSWLCLCLVSMFL